MSLLERLGLPLLRQLDPEQAHGIALKFLRSGTLASGGPVSTTRLQTSIAGLQLPNPVGVAAGFDKNAEAVDAILQTGFGFCEIGAVTPRPQEGNPRPRLFRLTEDEAAINRFGFNNLGEEVVRQNLLAHQRNGIVGINLGANKHTEDKAADYISVLRQFLDLVDFATINVSSPNTEKLRDLQGRAALDALLARVLAARDDLGALPVFLKVAPDLDDTAIRDIADVCLDRGIDGVIATNTTLDRQGLRSTHAKEAGGLSGKPLMARSTQILRSLFLALEGKVPMIGVGGISSAEDAYTKIRSGASAVQLYTSMVYNGVGIGRQIALDLDALLERDGFTNVAEAVGADN